MTARVERRHLPSVGPARAPRGAPTGLETIDRADAGADRERSTSLERGLQVLAVLLASPFGMTLAAVARETGLSRAAARRFLRTLCDTGHVSQSGRDFMPTLRVGALGRCALTDERFWARFQPPLRRLCEATGESCSAAVLDGGEIEYVARAAGPRVLSVGLAAGSRLPACHTSMGRVLLASLAPERRAAVVGARDHPARTARTLVSPPRILDAIERAASIGHAAIDQELEDDLVSVAVPVRSARGTVVAALNSSATASRCPVDRLVSEVVPLLEATAAELTELFDARPRPDGPT